MTQEHIVVTNDRILESEGRLLHLTAVGTEGRGDEGNFIYIFLSLSNVWNPHFFSGCYADDNGLEISEEHSGKLSEKNIVKYIHKTISKVTEFS